MASFRSNDDFFQAVADLATTLEGGGSAGSAATLRAGLRAANGLTDGWALLLGAIEEVQGSSLQLQPEVRERLETLREAAHSAVYRR
jgi:hypothetical protein